jgi:hypothetical protein
MARAANLDCVGFRVARSSVRRDFLGSLPVLALATWPEPHVAVSKRVARRTRKILGKLPALSQSKPAETLAIPNSPPDSLTGCCSSSRLQRRERRCAVFRLERPIRQRSGGVKRVREWRRSTRPIHDSIGRARSAAPVDRTVPRMTETQGWMSTPSRSHKAVPATSAYVASPGHARLCPTLARTVKPARSSNPTALS